MAFRWRADDDQTLNASLVAVISQGIQTRIARKFYISVTFQGVADPLSPLRIRTWEGLNQGWDL